MGVEMSMLPACLHIFIRDFMMERVSMHGYVNLNHKDGFMYVKDKWKMCK